MSDLSSHFHPQSLSECGAFKESHCSPNGGSYLPGFDPRSCRDLCYAIKYACSVFRRRLLYQILKTMVGQVLFSAREAKT